MIQKLQKTSVTSTPALPKPGLRMARSDWTAAMDELLEIIMRDKAWGDEAPRKTYVAILELLTPPAPKAGPATPGKSAGGIELMGKSAVQEDPQAALVSSYRRRLQHDAELGRPQPVSRSSASRYLAAVFSITSRGRRGAGGVLSQGLPLTLACSSQSRTNCLS